VPTPRGGAVQLAREPGLREATISDALRGKPVSPAPAALPRPRVVHPHHGRLAMDQELSEGRCCRQARRLRRGVAAVLIAASARYPAPVGQRQSCSASRLRARAVSASSLPSGCSPCACRSCSCALPTLQGWRALEACRRSFQVAVFPATRRLRTPCKPSGVSSTANDSLVARQ